MDDLAVDLDLRPVVVHFEDRIRLDVVVGPMDLPAILLAILLDSILVVFVLVSMLVLFAVVAAVDRLLAVNQMMVVVLMAAAAYPVILVNFELVFVVAELYDDGLK